MRFAGLPFLMNTRTTLYCVLVIAVALCLIALQDWTVLSAVPTDHLFGVIALIVLAVLSEVLSVIATVGTQQASSSIAFLPLFASVLLFPLPLAIAASVATSIPTQLLVHRRPLLRAGFNTAQAALALIIAAAVFESLGGQHALPLQISGLRGFASFAAMAATFFFINQVLVSIAIAFSSGTRLVTVFSRIVAPTGANLLYDVLASPIAVVVALLYSYFGIWGLAMVSLPLLVIRHSYKSNLKLQQANKDLLTVLVKTIETRDPYTSGHSIRVSILARAIAEDMDMSAGAVDRIEMAALVHDIGKVDAVYASIIRKEGSLTDAERKIIVTHAAKGAEFLKTLASFGEDIIRGVRHHHERYDGTGYPDGLTGDEIPLPARIIMLCDSIDAMLSDRPYRKALTVEHVRNELLRYGGSQFDPRVVDVILRRNTLERAASLVRPDTAKPRPYMAVTA